MSYCTFCFSSLAAWLTHWLLPTVRHHLNTLIWAGSRSGTASATGMPAGSYTRDGSGAGGGFGSRGAYSEGSSFSSGFSGSFGGRGSFNAEEIGFDVNKLGGGAAMHGSAGGSSGPRPKSTRAKASGYWDDEATR